MGRNEDRDQEIAATFAAFERPVYDDGLDEQGYIVNPTCRDDVDDDELLAKTVMARGQVAVCREATVFSESGVRALMGAFDLLLANAERERDAYRDELSAVNVVRRENEVRAILAEDIVAAVKDWLDKPHKDERWEKLRGLLGKEWGHVENLGSTLVAEREAGVVRRIHALEKGYGTGYRDATDEADRGLAHARAALSPDRISRLLWKQTMDANLNTDEGCEQAAAIVSEYALALLTVDTEEGS